jgi:K+/H+ antiporter YhaU regulatory subunit KhtT
MRTLKVRHQTLPHVGELFELITASGVVVTIVTHRASGRRDLVIRRQDEDEPLSTTGLTRNESAAIAALLVGAHIELCPIEQL